MRQKKKTCHIWQNKKKKKIVFETIKTDTTNCMKREKLNERKSKKLQKNKKNYKKQFQ